jgi:hypothetical protein
LHNFKKKSIILKQNFLFQSKRFNFPLFFAVKKYGVKFSCGEKLWGEIFCGEIFCGEIFWGEIFCGEIFCGEKERVDFFCVVTSIKNLERL